MSGCSLHEAFPDTAKKSGDTARKHERAKAQRCQGPALQFLKSSGEAGGYSDLDPDRQAQRPLPPAERMDGHKGWQEKVIKEGFAAQDAANLEYAPVKPSECAEQDRELLKNLVGQQVDDVIGQKSRMSLPRAAEGPAQLPDFGRTQYGEVVPSYFGKGLDGFADFSSSLTDNPGYTVPGSDFQKAFDRKGLEKVTGESLPPPSLQLAWKPMTPSGANTAFFDEHIEPGGTPSAGDKGVFTREEKESLIHQIDTLFAKIDEIQSKSNQYAHAEVTMFILSGLILMFGLETVRKLR